MIRILFLFVLLFLAILIGIKIQHDPGYLLIAINHWSLETTVWVALIALIILFISLQVILFIMRQTIRLPDTFRQWRSKQQLKKAHAKTRQGLIEFGEGQWSAAKNHLLQALPYSEIPLLHYLSAAHAAQEMEDYRLRDQFLQEAQRTIPDAKIAVELTQAQLQLAKQQWEQARITLHHLHEQTPHHPELLKLFIYLYQETHDWLNLINLLPELKTKRILSETAFDTLMRHAFLQALNEQTTLPIYPHKISDLMKKLPKSLANDAEIKAAYCALLIKHHEDSTAETLLRQHLRKQFNEKLVNLYGQIHVNKKQLLFAESLLNKHHASAKLYLCAGRLSFHNELWGKAKNYLEKSLTLEATPETYYEMGKLLEKFGDVPQACKIYREGLALIGSS